MHDKPKTPRVLLVMDNDGAPLQACVKALDELDASYDIEHTLANLQERLLATAYNGIILDVPTVIRSAASVRADTERVLDFYPTFRIMYAEGRLNGLCCGRTPGGRASLDEFIQRDCASFSPRCIRYTHRVPLVFNVLLFDRDGMDLKGAERTVTFNLSEAGGFVFTTRDWSDRKKAWLVFEELVDRTSIPTTVRRHIPWGTTMDFPGIGVTFDKLTDSQQKELALHLDNSSKGPSYA